MFSMSIRHYGLLGRCHDRHQLVIMAPPTRPTESPDKTRLTRHLSDPKTKQSASPKGFKKHCFFLCAASMESRWLLE